MSLICFKRGAFAPRALCLRSACTLRRERMYARCMCVRERQTPAAAKSSLQSVTSEPPQTEDPPIGVSVGAHTSPGCVGGGQRPPSELGIVFRLASMPVLRSNCGISAGSHRKGGSRDSHRWPRKVIPARQVRCSSGRATNTRLWVGRTQQPQLFSRLPAFWDVCDVVELCRRLGLVFLCVTRVSLFRATARQGELCPFCTLHLR